MLIHGLYYFFAGLVGMSALCMLFTRHTLYAALCLVGVSIGLSAIYFLQGATWIAITYLLVYASGVLVIILFAVFMLRPLELTRRYSRIWYKVITFLGVGLCLAPLGRWTIQLVVATQAKNKEMAATAVSVHQLGYQLIGPYALLLEIVGIMLLVAVVGALYVVQKEESS